MPYGLQAQVYRHLRAARPLPGGRVLKRTFQAVWRHTVQINDETPWHLPLGQYHGDITRLIVCAMLFYFFISLSYQRPQLYFPPLLRQLYLLQRLLYLLQL